MIIETRGDVIKLKGALVENQWSALRSAIKLVLDDFPRGVIIDASGLTELSESGARTFLELCNFVQSQNARVVVVAMPDEMLAEIRKIPGVRSQLVTANTVEEARASLEAGGTPAVPLKKPKPFVLVPLLGAWQKGVEFAAIEASFRRAELHLLYVLQIPRYLPLGEPVPEMEQEAQKVLDEAEKLVKRRGVVVRKLTTRARDLIDGVAKFAAEKKPDLLVVAYYKEEITREGARCAAVETLCNEVPSDVAIYCVSTY
jgi:nucleotide-binding universal stress UspA family protein/anti-anti-sigma regulatory factor